MKKTYTLLLILCLALSVNAQKEANFWYFGFGAGLDFNSGSPVALTNGKVSTTEGSSTMSDANGNLLLYTDGLSVYNKNHTIMPNGSGLMGGSSSSQSAIIVRLPGSTSLYYIFTVPDQGSSNGFRYSIVDMTLQGGLGNVTASKNVLLRASTTEKLTATKHANGTDYWIVMHGMSANTFCAFLLSAAGVNTTPVLSNVGLVHATEIGYMKFSHDGAKLGVAITYDNRVELFDFNNATGTVSNPITFPNTYIQPYGLEFSPDNTKLYFAESGNGGGKDSLYQFDLLAGSPAAILASGVIVGKSSNQYLGPLQMGPDCKIYVARYNTGYLGVINNPNLPGKACNYVDQGLYLAGKMSAFGLPNVITSCASVAPPSADLEASDSAICEGFCIDFNNLSQNAVSYKWIFPGALPATDTALNPQNICYYSAGNYDVTLVATNSGGSDSVTYSNLINVQAAPPTPVITQNGTTLYCTTDPGYTSYQWYDSTTLILGATDTSLVISHGGNYNVQVSNENGCKVAVGINVILGMQNYVSDNGVKLYPNPAKNGFTVYGLRFTVSQLEIVDVLGRALYQSEIVNPKFEIDVDVSMLAAGVYFIHLKGESSSLVERFVKE